jgi:phage protein D
VASTFQLLLDGEPADDDFLIALSSLEIEENADLPGALLARLAVSRTADGDLDYPDDSRVRPFANLAVVATPDGGSDECIFDGYVLSHKLHIETGVTAATLEVWAQDSSWLMNLEEKTREWIDVTDSDVAASIFNDYGIEPSGDNTAEDSPAHTEDGHSLMQRSSDIQFLRTLARRNGKLCRVFCTDTPGERTGYFAMPDLLGAPVLTLSPNDPVAPSVGAVDVEWDAARPTAVDASQATFDQGADADGVSGDSTDSGLPPLDARGLDDFTGETMTVRLTTTVDDAGELAMRSRSLLRESDWFVSCETEADVSRIDAVPRVGQIVALAGVGTLHSGNYLVWSVRHTITVDQHRMRLRLVRNAVGPEPTTSLLGGFE